MFKPGDLIQCVEFIPTPHWGKVMAFKVLEVKNDHYLLAWLKPNGEDAHPEKWKLKFSDQDSYRVVTQKDLDISLIFSKRTN